jgi:hypothetical protein
LFNTSPKYALIAAWASVIFALAVAIRAAMLGFAYQRFGVKRAIMFALISMTAIMVETT